MSFQSQVSFPLQTTHCSQPYYTLIHAYMYPIHYITYLHVKYCIPSCIPLCLPREGTSHSTPNHSPTHTLYNTPCYISYTFWRRYCPLISHCTIMTFTVTSNDSHFYLSINYVMININVPINNIIFCLLNNLMSILQLQKRSSLYGIPYSF